MFAQLWHTGRASHVENTGGLTPVSASVNPEYWNDASKLVSTPSGWQQPSPHRALAIEEIPGIIEDYRKAAERAKAAGLMAWSCMGPTATCRRSSWTTAATTGRTRMADRLRTARAFSWRQWRALVSVWGGDRVAVRIAPGGTWNGMSDSKSAGAVWLSCRAVEPVLDWRICMWWSRA